jgi:site-specific DNA-methyltransferase (adenine-specific)
MALDSKNLKIPFVLALFFSIVSEMEDDFKYPEEIVKTIDCVKGMKSIPDDSVDVVVTSPPYNLGIQYSKYMDQRSQEEYLKWCRTWASEVARVLKPEGSFFLNLGSSPSNPTIPHELLVTLLRNEHRGTASSAHEEGFFFLQNNIHWIKAITISDGEGNEYSRGHFKPINSRRFVNDCHEYIFHLTLTCNTPIDRKAIGVAYQDKSNIKRWGHTDGVDRRCRGNTWFLPYHTIQNKKKDRPHPATFPPELPEQCIRLHGAIPGETVVLDPFLGIGNSWIAAIRCNAGKFYGFEMDSEYVKLARKYSRDWSIIDPGKPPRDESGEDFGDMDETTPNFPGVSEEHHGF